MTTANSSNDALQAKIKDDSLELFSLVWLDTSIDTEENRETLLKLRTIINFIKVFKDEQACQRYIEQLSETDRLFLIASGRSGKQVIPLIHKFRHVASIYIYCMEKASHITWARQFWKIKGVVATIDELFSLIKTDLKIHMKVEEPLQINIFSRGKALMGINGQFVFSQVLIDCLLRMKQNQRDLNELYTILSNEYDGNGGELALLRQFQQSYSPTQALRWYTRESFFHKTLNAALRTPNIHMIYLFRSFIADIHRQLQNLQAKHRLRTFRGQLMSIEELQPLENSIGELISINSFFSSSTDYEIAVRFLSQSTSGHLERVIFEIDADPQMVTTKPFADISIHSDFVEEAEVLFSYGTIFRLNSVSRTEQQLWSIGMSLCDENENELNDVQAQLMDQIGTGETNLWIWGKLLWKMGKFDLAEKYYYRFYNELPPNDPLIRNVCEDLADLAAHRSDLDMSIEWRKKSLQKKQSGLSVLKSEKAHIVVVLLRGTGIALSPTARWSPNGITVAGGYGTGSELCQLDHPQALYVSENLAAYVVDTFNHRIVAWLPSATTGRVVAGGNGPGSGLHQLKWPSDVIIDQSTDSLLICDYGNARVVCWPLRGCTEGEIVLSNIDCYSLTLDDRGCLYVSDSNNHEVWRCPLRGDSPGICIGGGNQKGDALDQLNCPTYLFVDRDRSMYVSDNLNHRIMKWIRGAREGLIVAGGYGPGSDVKQFNKPRGVLVDEMNTLYVADEKNHRIMRWLCGATQGTLVAGGNGNGSRNGQLNCPRGLSFDKNGCLYVADYENARVQKFELFSP
ncbi:unnamed protein product [Rotaria magnacalcarata]|uniref:NAD(+)--protein-arginine ADP-ribosyltransferase n=1 Tax=Rotaria magnacalcarata TaxID=392030 RepID=A0A816QKM9_9BILA|nr:unnamed protein product [Rotaria magnacalcarata]